MLLITIKGKASQVSHAIELLGKINATLGEIKRIQEAVKDGIYRLAECFDKRNKDIALEC